MIQSSVWNATSTPARSSAAPLSKRKPSASSLPPGVSTTMSETGTPAAAISSATFQASLTWCSTARKPNSLATRMHGEDVVVAVGVVLHDALAVEHLQQRLHAEVALRRLLLRIARSAASTFSR